MYWTLDWQDTNNLVMIEVKRGLVLAKSSQGKGQHKLIELEASRSGGTSYQLVVQTDGFMPSSPSPIPVSLREEHHSTIDPWMDDLQDILVSQLIEAVEEAEEMDCVESRALCSIL
ncbi:hypothetical protein BJ322DRAFT_1024521 [Thelephora terrestris]|uniref:Uncharacterized protein n=1 Tax=Thelephora terrestris TaxID=56493 RepID=A0A9P6H851_9AGAM|nr:hypothetical protein BJ322DRAFT_1024521 [Thelephora terrestris]